MNFKCFIVLLIFISSAGFIYSQNTYEFLRIDMSPRAAALGGSFVSNNDDADVIFYNPSGINLLTGNPVSFSYVNYLSALDINLASLSYSTNYPDIGRIGAAVKYINYGSFTEADEQGNRTGEYGAGEVAFILGYGNSLDEDFYYGVNLKYIFSSLAGRSSSAVAADLGLHYAIPSQEMNIGFAVLNMGTQVTQYFNTKEELPLDVVIGVSKKLEHLPLRLSLDFHKLNLNRNNFGDRFKAFTVGAEFTLSRVLKLRLGYDNERRSDVKLGSGAGIGGFNIGFGANISTYTFNYGFSSMGDIGGIHRIGISTSF